MVAVFIDGCFWHGYREHRSQPPRVSTGYWGPKVERIIIRDNEARSRFQDACWLVIRSWEHEAPEAVVARVELALEKRGRPVRTSTPQH